jgi:hypothetical protein
MKISKEQICALIATGKAVPICDVSGKDLRARFFYHKGITFRYIPEKQKAQRIH